METRVQRVLQNRWAAEATAVLIGYVALRVMLYVVEGAYYDFYFYPRTKGTEYSYPELRYTFGQTAILLWSLLGICTAALAGRSALLRDGARWSARCAIAFALGLVLLVVGLIAGMWLRDVGF